MEYKARHATDLLATLNQACGGLPLHRKSVVCAAWTEQAGGFLLI